MKNKTGNKKLNTDVRYNYGGSCRKKRKQTNKKTQIAQKPELQKTIHE